MYFDKDVDKSNPWTTLDSKIVYKTPWVKVVEDNVKTPNGDKSIYSYVDKSHVAVAAIPLTANNEVYLVGQYRYPMKEYTWELIEGGSEENEDALTAIKRELKEEGGIVAKKFDVIFEDLHISNSITNERGTIFLVRDFVIEESTPEPTEKLTIKKLPFGEVLNLVYQGKIKDSFSVVGILMAEKFLSNKNK